MNTSDEIIAVVDDEESVRKALERLLRSFGFKVGTFSSGAAFLAAMNSLDISCVLLDLDMPGIDGFDVQAALTAAGRKIPLIIITGHDIAASSARFSSAVLHAFVKPIDGPALLDALKTILPR